MPFFRNNSSTKISRLSRERAEIESQIVRERAICPEVWDNDATLAAAYAAVQKQPTAENVRELVRLISQKPAAIQVVQLLATVESDRRTKLLLALRGLAHDAADEVKKSLKARLVVVEKSDAATTEELGKLFRSDEVIFEINRRIEYLESCRAFLDAGQISEALGRLSQASDGAI